MTSDDILAAVRAALSDFKKDDDRNTLKSELTARIAALTARERQVLEGLVAGNPNKTIAYEPRDQPAHGGNLSRERNDENEGRQPFRAGAHGIAGGAAPQE